MSVQKKSLLHQLDIENSKKDTKDKIQIIMEIPMMMSWIWGDCISFLFFMNNLHLIEYLKFTVVVYCCNIYY